MRASSKCEAVPKSCLYCSSLVLRPRFTGVQDCLGYVPGAWDFLECGDCGSLVLSPFPTAEETATFYPAQYNLTPGMGKSALERLLSTLECRLFFEPTCFSESKLVLKKTVGLRSPGVRLLDVGCGTGTRMRGFRHYGADVTGVDFSAAELEPLKRRYGLNVIVSDVASLEENLKGAMYDVITSFDVIEHLTDPERDVRRCLARLKPGGWFVAGIPSVECFGLSWFGTKWKTLTEAPRHVSVPSSNGARRLFDRLHLTDVSLHPYTARSCSLPIAASLIPSACAHTAYGAAAAFGKTKRLLAATATIAAMPMMAWENYVLKRPSRLIVVGRKAGAR